MGRTLDSVLESWMSLDEAELRRPWTWRDGKMELSYVLYRTLEDAQESLVRVTASPCGEAQCILALAQRAFGELRALVSGVPDDLLDKAPRPGEWTVREVLRHVHLIERRYATQTAWAVERGDADPMRIPDARMPKPDEIDGSGNVGALLGRIAEARRETDRRLAHLAPAALTRPTPWLHHQGDVRFRLHRFAAHIVEHTVQCEKALDALGWHLTEGRRVVRAIWAHVGELEGLGATEELSALERLVEDRARSVAHP
jgi:hypothetical protein